MAQLFAPFSQLPENFTFLALFLALFLKTFWLTLPGETILVTTSVISSQGEVSIYFVVAVAIFASIAGDSVAVMIGRRSGRAVVLNYGSRVGTGEEKCQTAERFTKT